MQDGKGGETFGEDPYLVTQMGTAMINGLQQDDLVVLIKLLYASIHCRK